MIYYERLQTFSFTIRTYVTESFLDKWCICGNRGATSVPHAAAFCRFRKEREWLISSRLD